MAETPGDSLFLNFTTDKPLRRRDFVEINFVSRASSTGLSQITSLDQDEVGFVKTSMVKPPLRIKPIEEKEYRLSWVSFSYDLRNIEMVDLGGSPDV